MYVNSGLPPEFNRQSFSFKPIKLVEPPIVFPINDDDYGCAVINKFGELRRNRRFTDITLRVHDEEMIAHKAILSAASPFFNSMFDDAFVESKKDLVELTHETTPKIMEAILDYIYSGKVTIKEDDMDLFLKNVDYLGMEDFKKTIARALSTDLNSRNCVLAIILADKYKLGDVIDKASCLLLSNYSMIYNSIDIKKLSLEELELILQIVHKPHVINTYATIMEWIEHDEPNREHHMYKLAKKFVAIHKIADPRLPSYSRPFFKNSRKAS